MSLEVRRLGVELSSFDEGTGAFEAIACTYNYLDGYNTRFLPGCFAESLRRSLPEVKWEHSRRIGAVEDYRDTETQLTILGQLDKPEGERRKLITRAWEGMRTGVLTEFSVGFRRIDWREVDGGVIEFIRADLDEVSLVIEGAVVGAQLVSTRSAAPGSRGPVYARIVNALGGVPAIRTPAAADPLVAEAAAILDRLR